MRKLRSVFVALATHVLASHGQVAAQPTQAQIPPRTVAPDGWYTDLGASDYQSMSQRQIRFNTFGDIVRNITPYIENLASVAKGAGEATVMVAEKALDRLFEEKYKDSVTPAGPDALTRLAESYANATNMNIDTVSNGEDYVTQSRLNYNDLALCKTGLLLCSSYFLSSKRVCSNNVIDPTVELTSKLRSVNIVEVACNNNRATIVNRWPPAAYRGPESSVVGRTLAFTGNPYSNYCVPCR